MAGDNSSRHNNNFIIFVIFQLLTTQEVSCAGIEGPAFSCSSTRRGILRVNISPSSHLGWTWAPGHQSQKHPQPKKGLESSLDLFSYFADLWVVNPGARGGVPRVSLGLSVLISRGPRQQLIIITIIIIIIREAFKKKCYKCYIGSDPPSPLL